METFVGILAIVLGALAIVGSIAPALPGPPLGWLGMLCLYIWGGGTNGAGEPMSTKFLLIWLGIVLVVSLLDYVVPAWFTKLTGGSKYGSWNADIDKFNAYVKKNLPSGIKYLNTNSTLKKEGFQTRDGCHYKPVTYKRIAQLTFIFCGDKNRKP